MKYKQGKMGGFAALLTVALISVAALLGGFVWLQGSAIGSPVGSTQQTIVQAAQDSKTGDAATVRVLARDLESNARSQVAVGLYVWDNQQKVLKIDNTTLSATARTAVSAAIGDEVTLCAFDGAYYGDDAACGTPVKVTRASQDIDLKVYSVANNLAITPFNNLGTAAAGPGFGDMNITLSANQIDSLDHIKVQQNMSNAMFRLKAFAVNVTAATNMDKVTVKGANGATLLATGEGDCKIPQRRRSDIDWLYCLPQHLDLHQFDVYNTGPVVFDASGTNPAEIGSFFILDDGRFKSVADATRDQVLIGLENDAPTPADVGALDRVISMNII